MLRLLLLLLLIASPAAAVPPRWAMPVLDQAFAAHGRGDYGNAAAGFRRLAAQGSAVAEAMLGAMAARGQGQRRDPATAAAWWLRAASRGYAPAQLALAQAYARGDGVARDRGTAWMWASLAASHGDDDTGRRAARLATRLAATLDAPALAKLERRRLAWRPWATLG